MQTIKFIIILSLAHLCLLGCNNPDGDYLDTSMSSVVSVSLPGVPDPDNNIEALEAAASSWSGDLSGVWQGELEYYAKYEEDPHPVLKPYPVFIELSKNDYGWTINSLYKRKSKKYKFYDVTVVGPRLEFTFEGKSFTTMNSPGGRRAIPYYATLIASGDEIKGVYREVIDEVGGQQFFVSYDVNLRRQPAQ